MDGPGLIKQPALDQYGRRKPKQHHYIGAKDNCCAECNSSRFPCNATGEHFRSGMGAIPLLKRRKSAAPGRDGKMMEIVKRAIMIRCNGHKYSGCERARGRELEGAFDGTLGMQLRCKASAFVSTTNFVAATVYGLEKFP